MALAEPGERLLERGAQSREVGIDHRLGMGERVLDVGRYRGTRRKAGEHVLIGPRGVARIAGLFQIGALLQQRGHMPRLQLERLLERVDLLRAAAERLEARREVCPQTGVLGIRTGRPREQCVRLVRRTPGEHAHAEFIEHSRMVRRLLRDTCQQLIGFRHPPGGRFRLGRLQYADDGGVVERRGDSGIHAAIV